MTVVALQFSLAVLRLVGVLLGQTLDGRDCSCSSLDIIIEYNLFELPLWSINTRTHAHNKHITHSHGSARVF